MRWLRCPHVSIVSTSTMRLTYAPILFLQVQLFAIVWVTLYGWKKRLLCRQTRFPHVDFTPRTLTMESLSSDNLGASGVERHMWAPTKLHQHWSAAALCGDVLPCNTLLDFFVLSHTLLFVTLPKSRKKEHKSQSMKTKLPEGAPGRVQSCYKWLNKSQHCFIFTFFISATEMRDRAMRSNVCEFHDLIFF